MKRLLLLFALIAAPLSAQVIITPLPGGGGSGSVTGGACPGAPDQMVVSISSSGVPTCSKVTSAFVDATVVAVGGAAGTPSSINLSNGTALPIATGVSGLGANVAAVLATFSSSNLRTAATDETGTGALFFAGGNFGAATGTSLSLSGLGGSGTRCVQTDNTGALAVAAAACGGSGATTALDNLAAVNINTAFLFQTGVDVGSTTKPARDLFLWGSGTYGTTYLRLTGTPTGARVLTLPNATGTLVYSGGPIDLSGATSTTLPLAAVNGLATGISAYLAAGTVSTFATAAGSQSANCIIAAPDGSAGSLSCRTATYGDLPIAVPITKLTTDTVLAAFGGTYQLNCATPCTMTLPPVAARPGQGWTFINIAGSSTATIDGNASEQICDPSGCANTKTIAANAVATAMIDADATYVRFVSQAVSGGAATTVYPKAPGLRLTTQSGTCQSSADRTSQSTLYYTPGGDCGGGSYAIAYSGSAWTESTQAELSLALSGLTSGKPYDVYYCYNSGTPNLQLSAAWTNDTTRSEAQAKQDGFVVKSADHTCLNVGAIYTTSTTATEDSAANAYVWNRFNKLPHSLKVTDTTDEWTYATATWRQARATATNQISYVTGDAASLASASVVAGFAGASNALSAAVAIGVDSTSSPTGSIRSGTAEGSASTTVMPLVGQYQGFPGLGKHTLVWLELGVASGTSIFLGDDGGAAVQSGISGTILN